MSENWNRADALKVRGIIEKMGLCGCGTDAHWETVLHLLERAENHDKNGSFYKFQLGNDSEDVRDSWVEFGAKVLDSWGLVEHGTGIGWAWLTDDGKLLLRYLRDFGTNDSVEGMQDDGKWPMWSVEFSWDETPALNDTFSEWEAGRKAAPGETE